MISGNKLLVEIGVKRLELEMLMKKIDRETTAAAVVKYVEGAAMDLDDAIDLLGAHVANC